MKQQSKLIRDELSGKPYIDLKYRVKRWSNFVLLLLFSTLAGFAQITAPQWDETGQKNNSGVGTAVTVDRPSNVAAGDLILLFFTQTKSPVVTSSSGFTTPAGFTRIHSEYNSASESRPEVVAFYKIADSSEPATYSSTATDFNRTPRWKAVAVRVTGHSTINPISVFNGANSGSSSVTSLTFPSLTTTSNNSLLVNALSVRRSISSVSVPTGMTQRWFLDGVGSSDDSKNDPALFGATQVIATAGATGTRVSNWSGSAQAAGLMFAINPNTLNVDLKVTKTVTTAAPHYFADNIVFSITATNLSTTEDASGVKVTDLLPPGLGFVSQSATKGTYTPLTGVWNIGALPKSSSETLTLTVKIICDESNFTNAATISGIEPDLDLTNNSASVSITPQTGGSNPCPIFANDDILQGLQGQPASVNVLSNDKGNYDATKLTIIAQPINGTLQMGANGLITYLPNGNYFGSDQFTYQICDATGTACDQAVVSITISEDYSNPCIDATRSKIYYLPFPENKDQLRKAFGSAGNQTISTSTVRSIVSVKVPYPNTIIVIDHWEDGYEADITVPTQPTTQIWGDGDLTNGVAPGYPNDIIPAGGYIIQDQTFGYNDRNPVQIYLDGKDKIFSSNNVFISKITGDAARFDVQNVKTDVLDVSRFGKFFRVGFGEDVNVPTGIVAFQYVSLFIRAAEDNTVVELDYDGDGVVDVTKTLNEGEVWFYDGTASAQGNVTNDKNKSNDIKAAATITASKPVGVDVMMGDISNYGTRNIYLLPSKFISNEYITPVHTTLSTAPVVAYFTNNLSTAITINWSNGDGGSGTLTLPAKGLVHRELSGNSAYKFKSANGEAFTAVVIVDADNSGSAYDWAYPMIPVSQLTNYTSLAWAPGSNNGTANYNPIWVTSLSNTTVYVKWDGNMTGTGPYVTACGLPYDTSYPLTALQSLKILDSSDNDQSGTAIFTCDGATIAGVWGQDANGGAPTPTGGGVSMDVGYVMQPGCLNQLVIANDDLEVTEPNEPVVVDVVGNDGGFLCSIDEASVSTAGLLQPQHGTIQVNNDGTITYTPESGYVGEDTFEYRICSFEYANVCDVALVTIKIRPCEDIAAGAGMNVVKGKVFLEITPDDGTYDNEALVPGIKVDLYSDKNGNGIIDGADAVIASTVTDASGRFNFQTAGDTFAKDTFDPTAGQYGVNNGTVNWSAAWSRSNSTRITSVVDATPDNSSNVALRLSGANETASRSLNFVNATGAALKFSFRRQGLGAQGEEVAVRLNGNLLGTISDGGASGTNLFYEDIVTPINSAYINANGANTLSFVTNGNMANTDYVFIDNVELIYFPANFIAKVNPVAGGDYVASTKNKASYSFSGIGNCSSYQYLGVMASIDAVNDSRTVRVDTPLKVDVLTNDKGKLDLTTLTTNGLTQPQHGTVTVNPDGTITYTPNPGYTGTDTFEYRVCSIEDPAICDQATVTLNVQCAYEPGKNIISGIVFGDIDADGVLDIGEKGVAGIDIELYDNANNLLQTKTTSSLGAYEFEMDCEKTVRDEFTTRVYSNNDGTANWKTNWVEDGTGETPTNPTAGSIFITTDGKLRVQGNGNSTQMSISRTVDLTNTSGATLSYTYDKSSFSSGSNDWVEVQVSSNGSTWTVLKRYSGTAVASGTDSFDISSHTSANTYIRLIESSNSNLTNTEYVLFDDLQIKYKDTSSKNYTVKLKSPLTNYDATTSTSHAVVVGCETAQCSKNFGVAASDLSIEKTVDDDEQYIGENVVFTLTVTNNGPSNNTGVVAVDLPPNGYEYVSDNGAGLYNPTTGNWAIGALAVGASKELKITVKVLETGNYTNTATVSGNLKDPDPDNSTDTSTVSGEPNADLQIVKSVSTNQIFENVPFVYTITLKNNGPSKSYDIVATDVLNPALQVMNATASKGSWDGTEWSINSLDKNETATLTIQCQVPANSNLGNLTNTVSVTSDTHDLILSNNESSVTTKVIGIYDPLKNNPPIAIDDNVTTTIGTPVTNNLLNNDSDPDGDVIKVTEIKVPSSTPGGYVTVPVPVNGTPTSSIDVHDENGNKVGEIVIKNTGEFTYTPTSPSYVGELPPVKYQICDNGVPVKCDLAELKIEVEPAGTNTTQANDDSNSAPKGVTMTGDVLANDVDIEGNTQTLTNIKYLNSSGVEQTLTPGNNADVYIEDPENLGTYIKTGNLALSSGVDNGKYTFVPEPNFIGTVSLGQTVCDDGALIACDDAVLTLSSLPIALVVKPDINQTPQNTPVNGNVLLNDSGDDVKVSTITVYNNLGVKVPINVPTDGTPTSTIDVHNDLGVKIGEITISNNGDYIFTPVNGYTGNVPMEYTVKDAYDMTGTTSLTIKVIPLYDPTKNNPPVAQDDNIVTNKDKPVTGNLISNDSDPDGDVIKVTEIKVPSSTPGVYTTVTVPTDGTNTPSTPVYDVNGVKIGEIIIKNTGEVTFTPEPGYVGVVPPMEYTICDNGSPVACDNANLNITVKQGNVNSTIANDDANSAPQGVTMTGNVLDNDEDLEGNAQTLTGIKYLNSSGAVQTLTPGNNADIYKEDPLNPGTYIKTGNLALSTGVDNGKYTFVPESNFVGTVSLGQTVCDNGVPQACDNAILLLTSIPSYPIANPDINQTPEGKSTNGNLLTNDEGFDLSVTTVTVPGGTPVTVPTDGSSVTIPIPGKGTITVDKTGEYTFTPEPGFTGEVPAIKYTIEDDNGLTDESTLIIQVIPTYNPNKNNPPVANDDYVTTTIDKPVTGDLTGNDSDPDKDPLTVTEIKVPANGGGTTTVNVPTDGSSTPSIDVYDGTTKVGTITVNKDGEFTFTPEDDFVGKVPPITYQVCDNGTPTGCDTAEIVVTVVDNHGENVTYANDDANSAKRGETMTGNVLDNDTDPENDTQKVTHITYYSDNTGTLSTETVTVSGITKDVYANIGGSYVKAGTFTINEAGAYTFVPESNFVGTVPVVYVITDNNSTPATDKATLYLTSLSSVNYWIGGEIGKENDWNTPGNWTDSRVPNQFEDVEFATSLNNSGNPAKENLHVPTGTPINVGNLTNKSNKSLVVPPSATIIVNGVVEGSENPSDVGKIVIEADKATQGAVPNGSFIALDACGNYAVYATVELWAQGQKVDETIKWTDNITGSPTAGTGLSSSHSWQHFGVPVENVVALDAFYDSWIQKYSEPQNGNIYGTGGSSTFYDKWNKVTPYETLNMFEGYEITQDVPTYYTIKGKLFFCDKTLTLTRKAVAVVGASGVNEHYALGQNVFGNSYTAAINLDNGIIFNDSEVEQTVYIYRTGSFQNWGNEGGIVTTDTKPNAGSYIAIPAKVGTTVWGNQIPSLQGFLLKFTNSETLYNQSDKTVTLKYIDGGVVGNTRPQLTQKAPLSHLTVTLKSKSTVDRAWLFSQEGTSDKFDNGWDGTKYFGTPTAFIYSESPFGKLQVNTSNTIDKKILTIQPNRDTAYELILDKTNLEDYEDLHLIDLVERKAISLNDERTVYNFTANHPNRAVKRFIIANSANIDMNSDEFKLVDGYLENNNELVLSNLTSAVGVAHLVDLSGKLIGTYSMKHAVTRVPVSLIRGVYVLRLEADGEVENVKLIVK